MTSFKSGALPALLALVLASQVPALDLPPLSTPETGLAAAGAGPTTSSFSIRPRIELGAAAVLSHLYRSGSVAAGNTLFDFVALGGQDNLLPFQRYTVDALLGRRNRLVFLYQPLSPRTSVRTPTGFRIDGVDFLPGSAVDILYGFDFWRLSWLYALLDARSTRLELGLSLQLRNANIVFTSVDGTARAAQRDVGPVPVLKLRAEQRLGSGFALILEGDGFYATDAFFNGADYAFKGWIWDAALSLEAPGPFARPVRLAIRSIGGGAEGTEKSGKYSYNSLATVALTLGFGL